MITGVIGAGAERLLKPNLSTVLFPITARP